MSNSDSMIALLRRLKVEMNGAVSASMTERGLVYGLNYGVSIPTIKTIAMEYFPNHSLAQLLYRQDVRELKIAALFIDDPQDVTRDQMVLWGESISNTEIAEQVTFQLFSKSSLASEVALEWIGCSNPLLCYAGLLMAARSGQSDLDCQMIEEVVAALKIWFGSDYFKQISQGSVQLLCKIALRSPQTEDRIRDVVAALSASEELKFVACELTTMSGIKV